MGEGGTNILHYTEQYIDKHSIWLYCTFHSTDLSKLQVTLMTDAERLLKMQEKIGKEIRRIRTAKGISQFELHRETGLSINYISLVENGKRMLSLTSLLHIADALGVKMSLVIKRFEEN